MLGGNFMNKKIILGITALLCAATIFAAGPVKIDGYNWLDIAVADDGTILACNTTGDMYVSSDKGASFTKVEGYDAVRVSMNSTGTMMAHVNQKGDLYYYDDGSGYTYNILNELANSGNENTSSSITSVNITARKMHIRSLSEKYCG